MFVVVSFMALLFTKKGMLGPEQAGAPGALKKNSQLLEFHLKPKKASRA